MLFEDHLLGDMNPITLTRPAFAVTCACSTLYEIVQETGAEVGLDRAGLPGENGRAAVSLPSPMAQAAVALPQRVTPP